MTLKYKVEFLDYWHLSSGLSAGARLDSTVVKDENTLPYLPGKTLKGLVREMAELLDDSSLIEKCFGGEGVKNAACYFSNATLPENVASEIIEYALQERLYDVIASTKIGNEDRFKNGKQIEKKNIAVDNSLREIEVVVPLTLEGMIDDVPKEYVSNMQKSLQMVKRMGLNRTRGLGRCNITIVEDV